MRGRASSARWWTRRPAAPGGGLLLRKGQGWGAKQSLVGGTSEAIPPPFPEVIAGVGRAFSRVIRMPLLADLMAEATWPPLPLSQGWERGRGGARGLAPLCWAVLVLCLALGPQPAPTPPPGSLRETARS